jgi:hypothetical protein
MGEKSYQSDSAPHKRKKYQEDGKGMRVTHMEGWRMAEREKACGKGGPGRVSPASAASRGKNS